MSKIKSNTEQVTEYMDFGSPINQAFVLHALDQMSKVILADPEKVKTQMKNSFIAPEAWIQCAKDWQASVAQNKINNAKL